MYSMKKIIVHDDIIPLPKCMYNLKNLIDFSQGDNFDIGVSDQVIKFLKGSTNKMAEIEHRQDQLLKKLDLLYDRIKTISTNCKASNNEGTKTSRVESLLPKPEEVVVVFSPDSIPWYLNTILKESSTIKIQWHVHSSVPTEKVPKIQSFVKHLQSPMNGSKTNLRLIFKCVAADTELKLSTLASPIIGNVNILRYLSLVYPDVLKYDYSNFHFEHLLDLCHKLERTSEKYKESIVNELFAQYKNWIYGNSCSIVDLAAYNVFKQCKNVPKYVPKVWFDKCDKLCSV